MLFLSSALVIMHLLSSADFFQNSDLGPYCLQKLSPDVKSHL